MMKKRGFTLIETLVYLALFALIISGLVVAAYALFESSARNQTKAMLQEEENFVMAKIVWTFNNAQQICAPAAGSSGSSLSLRKYGGTCFPPDVTVTLTSGDVVQNGDTLNPLNNSNITIGNLVFTHTYAGGSNPDSITIDLTASAKAPNGMTITQSASTTRYIRK